MLLSYSLFTGECKCLVKIRPLKKAPVDDTMSFAQASLLEFCARAIERLVAVVFPSLIAGKKRRLGDNRIDMLGVIGPVGRDVQSPVCFEATVYQFEERGLDHATLVMAFLGPRVGKIDVDPIQGVGGYLVLQNLDGVVLDESQVLDACSICLQ